MRGCGRRTGQGGTRTRKTSREVLGVDVLAVDQVDDFEHELFRLVSGVLIVYGFEGEGLDVDRDGRRGRGQGRTLRSFSGVQDWWVVGVLARGDWEGEEVEGVREDRGEEEGNGSLLTMTVNRQGALQTD